MQQRYYAKMWEWAKARPQGGRIFAAARGAVSAGAAWISGRTRLLTLLLGALIVGGLVIAAIRPAVMSASEVNVLANGSFEEGFQSIAGCGVVGRQWNCFTNGGAANFGFYDDQWEPVVADGKHSQLIEINTYGISAPDPDRYAGISQTVKVRPHAAYVFKMRGMVRTTHLEGDPWRYRVEVGWLPGPHANWRDVTNWVDAGWDTYYGRTKPGGLSHFTTTLRPNADVITVFVRVWKKWGVPNEEIDVNLDALGLFGPSPAPVFAPGPGPAYGGPVYAPHQPGPSVGVGGPIASPPGYVPAKPEPAVVACGGPNLVHNGNFEAGFSPMGQGEVGQGWSAFTNGGAIHVGFRSEDWSQVISDGAYGQAIELSSQSLYPTDADRYAGISQRIGGLHPGATYELNLRGLVRGTDGSHDPYRFEAQWGYTGGYQDDWRHVKNWERLDLGPIYPLEQPVAMGSQRVRFTAPAASIVLYIRGWKKWAVTNEQMTVNLDGISLHACGGVGGPVHSAPAYLPVHPGPIAPAPVSPPKPGPIYPEQPTVCTYTVRAGDTLASIARRMNLNTQDLIRINRIQNPNLIYVGQVLTLPTCAPVPHPPIGPGPHPGGPPGGSKPREPAKPGQPGAGVRTYTVRAGDTLSAIAVRFNASQQQLAQVNGIRNPNHIYIGQVLRIP